MNSTMPRIIAGTVAAGLVAASLAGCSTAAPGDSPDGEPIVLRYWSWAPNIAQIVDVWNQANPDVQVEVNTSVGAADRGV
ncbi:MAG: hypothetical protein EOO67_20445, partial [Microbacterium sp.]